MKVIKEWESHGGKKIQLVTRDRVIGYRFEFNPGGELPEELHGVFTEERYAIDAVNRYLDRTKPKDKK